VRDIVEAASSDNVLVIYQERLTADHFRDVVFKKLYPALCKKLTVLSLSGGYSDKLQREMRRAKKGAGFEQPLQPHQHWHIDFFYVNVCATFYYLCSILDGYSRFLVHWDLRESMTEADTEIILERAKERYPGVKPRIISDNGPQSSCQGL